MLAMGMSTIRKTRPTGPPHARQAGFTMVELLAVVVIIAVVAGLIIGVAGFGTRKATYANAQAELERIKIALEEYRLEYGAYLLPNESDWDKRFTDARTERILAPLTNYVDTAQVDFIDPWGRIFKYEQFDTFEYRLWSRGPDADPEDDHDDITNWKGN